MLAVGAWLGAFVGALGALPPSVGGPSTSYLSRHVAQYAGAHFGGTSGFVAPPPDPDPGPDPGPGPDPEPPPPAVVPAVVVPYVIGKTVALAASRISGAGFVVFIQAGTGTVTAQDPPAFVLRPRGSAVTVTLGGIVRGAPSRRKRGLPPYQTPEGYK